LKALRAFGDCALKIDYLIEAGLNTDTVSCSEETGSELKVVVQEPIVQGQGEGVDSFTFCIGASGGVFTNLWKTEKHVVIN